MADEELGVVTRYFGKIGVAAIKIEKGTLKQGDRIRFEGHTTGFEQVVESMQIEGDAVDEAGEGDEVGIKVSDHARPGDTVYKVG